VSLWPVLSQKAYPGVGDIDDCWAIATIWAATGSDPCLKKPTITRFRWAAGNPDDPYRADGGNLSQISKAVPIIWPTAKYHAVQTRYWPTFKAHMGNAHFISLAVDSGKLPAALRFGFYGNHQVGIWRSPRTGYIYCANPLAPQGSRPVRITEAALKYAAMGLEGAAGWILAACFTPIPVHLRYGGRRTAKFPDRTRSDRDGLRVYNRPDMPDRDHKVGTLNKGDLFTAYQEVTTGGYRMFGDHRGTKWVNAAKLDYKGGST
jgi:hypothetical protein